MRRMQNSFWIFTLMIFCFQCQAMSQGLRGDYNGDGSVDGADLDLVLANWGTESPPGSWINDLPSATIGESHFDRAWENLGNLTSIDGDYNGDEIVDGDDIDLVLGNWGNTCSSTSSSWTHDLPPTNTAIDAVELDIVLGNWGDIG